MTPVGPNGEKRPADTTAQAVMIGRIATGEADEEYVDAAKRRAERNDGRREFVCWGSAPDVG